MSELVRFENRAYPPLVLDREEFAEAIKDNMGDGGMSASDLMRVKVPSGGGRTWAVGDDETKELKGIIIYHTSPNGYWAESFSGGHVPPDCSSVDGITGVGNPGGECSTCPFNQFGSDGGKGKACKNMKLLYILTEGNMLPLVVSLPPSSLSTYRKYTVGLTTRAISYFACETILTLRKEKNPDGIEYSAVEFKLGEMLGVQDKESIKSFRNAIIPMLEQNARKVAADQ